MPTDAKDLGEISPCVPVLSSSFDTFITFLSSFYIVCSKLGPGLLVLVPFGFHLFVDLRMQFGSRPKTYPILLLFLSTSFNHVTFVVLRILTFDILSCHFAPIIRFKALFSKILKRRDIALIIRPTLDFTTRHN